MLLRVVRSTLVGIGSALCVAILAIATLKAYLKFFWVPAHPRVGAVVGAFCPLICLMLIAFVAGFLWYWRHVQRKDCL